MPSPLFDLTGKCVLVTGGNSGIGLGFAKGVAEAGADVCIWGRNSKKLVEAEKALNAFGTKIVAMQCDVSDRFQVEQQFAATLAALGKVDTCFANAAIGSRGTPFVKITQDEWDDILRVNLDGMFHTLQVAVRYMVERGEGGSLVTTSSGSTIFGAPRAQHYASTKAAATAMMKGLAVEYARYGIRVNTVIPGWIDTPMTERVIGSEPFEKKVLTRIPLRRWGTGDDFRGIAVYLASDASAYHTGDTFMIDGGYGVY
jgi:hypothetical protein